MDTILIVEDEPVYQDLLVQSLASPAYHTQTVASGEEAIAVGVRLRPRLLIADWLLQTPIHGLQVAAALRVVDPQLRTLLITGFDATDLRMHATQLPGGRYLRKPFRRQTLLQEVTEALLAPPLPCLSPAIAVVEIEATGKICAANAAARALFAMTTAGATAQDLTAVLDFDPRGDLDATMAQWREVFPRLPRSQTQRWWLGVRPDSDMPTRLLVLAPQDEDILFCDPGVRLFLNLPAPTEVRWPWSGAVLLIDADPETRGRTANQLVLTGVVCHTAQTPEEGLWLFHRNPAITVVILADASLSSLPETLRPLVAQVHQRQTLVQLVGTSPYDRRQAFATLGVPYFLRRPWHAAALYALLAGERAREPL